MSPAANHTLRWYSRAARQRRVRSIDPEKPNRWLDSLAEEVARSSLGGAGSRGAARLIAGEMAAACLRLATDHAPLGRERGHDRYDLAQIAMEAVFLAATAYDPHKGPFFPFAYQRARWAIYRVLYEGYLVRIPPPVGQSVAALRKAARRNGGNPVAAGDPGVALAAALSDAGGFVALENAPEESLDERVAAPDSEGSEEEAERLVEEDRLRRALEAAPLTERERHVLTNRFGLDNGRPKPLREVADELGISAERVRQLQYRAFEKLTMVMRTRPYAVSGEVRDTQEERF